MRWNGTRHNATNAIAKDTFPSSMGTVSYTARVA
jgi:uncharacterized repeat protein (TIGR01451 family)